LRIIETIASEVISYLIFRDFGCEKPSGRQDPPCSALNMATVAEASAALALNLDF